MGNEDEQVVSLEIRDGTIILYSTKGLYFYDADMFLCDIFEKLSNLFEKGIPCNEFFNYIDTEGAWTLLSDYFQKTDYLKNATLESFDEYRSRYGIGLEYKKGESLSRYDGIDLSDGITYKEVFWKIAYQEVFHKDFDKWRKTDKAFIDQAGFNPNTFRYYSCRTMIDFVFSMVHYCIYNNLVITHCAHCGKLFITNSLKVKYCHRKSPFPGYTDYCCGDAVKALKDKLEKKRIAEYERLRQRAAEYGTSSSQAEMFNTFCQKCSYFKDQMKKGATIKLLSEYQEYLFSSPGLRRKYERMKYRPSY